MLRSRLATALAAASAALALAACGVDDAIADQCLREAERIQEPGPRAAAEEACRAAQDGDISADDAKRRARERCLEETDRIANEAARQDARRRCEDIR